MVLVHSCPLLNSSRYKSSKENLRSIPLAIEFCFEGCQPTNPNLRSKKWPSCCTIKISMKYSVSPWIPWIRKSKALTEQWYFNSILFHFCTYIRRHSTSLDVLSYFNYKETVSYWNFRVCIVLFDVVLLGIEYFSFCILLGIGNIILSFVYHWYLKIGDFDRIVYIRLTLFITNK